jgi:hypothetical protein
VVPWPRGQVLDSSAAEVCLIISSNSGNAAKMSMLSIAIDPGKQEASQMRNNERLLDNKAVA